MKQYISLLFSSLLLLCLSSCRSDDGMDKGNELTMSFNGSIADYDDAVESRASSVSFSANDKIYIVLYNGSTKVNYGVATYDGRAWSFNPNNGLTQGSGDAMMYYFTGASSVNSNTVECGDATVVYSCTGKWSFSLANNIFSVSGTLTPAFSRIMFTYSTAVKFTMNGVEVPKSYSIADGKLTTETKNLSKSINSNNWSDYIYVTPSSLERLSLTIDNVTYEKNNVPTGNGVRSISCPLPSVYNRIGWSSSNDDKDEPTVTEPKPKAIDLGLSVKWADYNLGASSPEEYGQYFAWGETSAKPSYNWSNYTLCEGSGTKLLKYNSSRSYGVVDNITILEAGDDAATALWGSEWRMPTETEFSELLKCTWTWTTQKGKNGYLVTGTNGNSIFLPAAGYFIQSETRSLGDNGCYWSSGLSKTSSKSYYLDFGTTSKNTSTENRYLGFSVRPVHK